MVSTHPSSPTPTGGVKPVLASGMVVAIAGLLVVDGQSVPQWFSKARPTANENCEAIVETDSRLSREQLAKLLTVPERDSKDSIREIVAEPYCRLPNLTVRSGVEAEREAYPLEFDPETQLVILYENDEYAGYRFRFE
jgi:DNA-binding transcriptional regulator YdaS (Cro superfamily)